MKQLKCILLSLNCTAIVEIIVLLGLSVYLNILRKGTVETVWCPSLKVKSNGNPDLLGQLIVKTGGYKNPNKTCRKLSIMLETVVAQNIYESYTSDMNPRYLNLNISASGCMLSQQTISTAQLYNIASPTIAVPGKQTKITWHSKQGAEINLKAVKGEGAIFIKRSGYYYVSSLLTLRAQNIKTTDSAIQTADIMSHVVNVMHHKEITEQVLLENVKSRCELAFENADWSSNIGAVFYLNEHDKVYLATSHPYNIATGDNSDYLSVHTIL